MAAVTKAGPRRVGTCALLLLPCLALALTGVQIMTVAELKPGMIGTGRSVFFGTEVREFGVEVVDVMRQVSPRGDLILCRLSGQGLEQSGVIAGMSGSPVYIDGRLIGAVSYAWGFAKEPLAGVTPAAEMLRIWDIPDQPRNRAGLRTPRISDSSGLTGLSALPLPLAMSGLTPALAALVEQEMRKFGFTPLAAAGSSSALPGDTLNLVPGSAVGIALTDGDVRISGIGTLTCRDGDRILAFGHPMVQAGSVSLPMVGGRIHSIVASVANSFKLFSTTAPLGTISQDRLAGVAGRIGPVPEMLPVTAVVSSTSGLDTYRFRTVDLENLAPMLIATGLADVIYQTEGNLEEVTLASRMTVHFTTAGTSRPAPGSLLPPLVIEHRFSGVNPAAGLFRTTGNELETLFANRFLPAPVQAVEFDVRINPGRDLAYLLSARPQTTSVHPGDSVSITLGLRDYRGLDSDMTVTIGIPGPTPEGNLRIVIGPPDSVLALEALRAPGRLEPSSFAELTRLLSETGSENNLVAVGLTARPGLTISGIELPMPPPSLRSVLLDRQSDKKVIPTSESPVLRQTFHLDRIISGVTSIDVEVKR